MKKNRAEWMGRQGVCSLVLGVALLLATVHPVTAAGQGPQVGDKAPHFSFATSMDTLVDYDRDYYGSHHLVLTFFPAAFTPV